ncbi:MAG TPA: TonB family protein [Pyrinomonadaceae bacterium]|nr:TonB family protein [Pyrinomonadaceae bacterium]
MFNNLIESSSHAKEFKRRGSFLLFTTATYLVLFVVTGVVSIYAYDAHLEAQSTELEITFLPPREAEPEPQPVRNTAPAVTPGGKQATESVRTILMATTSNPTKVPDEIGIKASTVPPANSWSKIGSYNAEPPAQPGGNKVGTGSGNTPVVEITEPPPPPPPKEEPPKVVNLSKGVIKGNALSLPKPIYSTIAKQMRLQGDVTVQVLIDENGNVISAKAVSGHPVLIPEVLKVARQARFKPTTLSGQPVKVSGMITYTFTLGQ